ncbi:hypothetical protein [Oceaniglobus trochenteri]|uniref:hypothetical protein n=1 Tax=Oceaniglobus trochenteri TaxID=2763260 RepID=UPI001CFFD2A8|nr:hypothetical protein [Oceaniglobus trochenteri]
MSNKTVALATTLGVLASIDPDAYAAGTVTTAWVPCAQWQTYMAVISAGDLGASATVDAKIEQAQDASGTGAKDLAGAEITQLTQAGSDSNTQAIISFSAADLDMENAFGFVRVSLTVAAATSDAGAILLGDGCRYGPASEHDAASVGEIVIVA